MRHSTPRADSVRALTADEGLVTIRQVEEMLAVCDRTIYRLARRGVLPAVHIGRALRFRRSDIERYIAEQLPISA